jgi:catechol 2,3-dioxygenase-like lactoylglutathione lyase family enzyme
MTVTPMRCLWLRMGSSSDCTTIPLLNTRTSSAKPRVGLDHVAFAVADMAELDEWRERLEGLGIAHSGIIESPSGHHLNFRDPDNIQLEFFASAF